MVDLYVAAILNGILVIIMTVGIVGEQKFGELKLTINEETNATTVIIL